jgi:S-adenosylmethionine hydrolase
MKGAILKINPRCQVIDVTHLIEPQNVLRASFVLKNTYPYYPTGTIHVVVVDPGVGTRRRPVVLKEKGHLFVGPDNGVFTFILSSQRTPEGYEITRKEFFLDPLSSRQLPGIYPLARIRDDSARGLPGLFGPTGPNPKSRGKNCWAKFSLRIPSAT